MEAQAPWGGSQQPDQVTIGATQPQTIAGIPANTQVIYVQAPAFKPSPNYRHISYLVLGIGIVLSLLFSFVAGIDGSEIAYRIGNSMCCGAVGIACVLDAIYYSGKSSWQQQTGANTNGTTIGMIADIIFAVLAFGIALLFLIGDGYLG
ncbi:MAG: hypothetical protein OSB32_01880 [Candidatus Poseidoniales archaeon]|nr:hypothetical protein [Candidatus Poseidoniales archaeon]